MPELESRILMVGVGLAGAQQFIWCTGAWCTGALVRGAVQLPGATPRGQLLHMRAGSIISRKSANIKDDIILKHIWKGLQQF